MIVTGCDGCCFLEQDDKGKGCSLGQICISKDGRIIAPGYCRQCRSVNWAKKQDEKDVSRLLTKIAEENILEMDLLIFFDENTNSIKDLQRTLDDSWYFKYTRRVIICDLTGFGDRENLALQYINSKDNPIPTVVDSSVLRESSTEWESTIKRLSPILTAPFFMAIPAGCRVCNMPLLSRTVQRIPSRVIQWIFPMNIGRTVISPNDSRCGLFITKPYRSLMRSPEEKSFSQRLADEEKEINMKLSWFCSECRLA
jgi:hypothetical protein